MILHPFHFLKSTLILVGLSPLTGAFGQNQEIKSIPGSTQFFLFGDWGRKGQTLANPKSVTQQIELAQEMEKAAKIMHPDFIISTGDNFYPDGVKSINDKRWQKTFESVYTGKHLFKPWYIVLGNHDHGGQIQAEIDYSGSDPNHRWRLPSAYYSQVISSPDGARIKFIFLDTTPLVDGTDTVQLKWLQNSLKDVAYDWKIVVGHHPLYSGNHRTSEQLRLRSQIEKLLKENGVIAYLCGHDHNLQYLNQDGIHYFVSGAGSEVYPSKNLSGQSRFIYCQEGGACTSAFMTFSVTRKTLFVQMVDANGLVVYTTSIDH